MERYNFTEEYDSEEDYITCDETAVEYLDIESDGAEISAVVLGLTDTSGEIVYAILTRESLENLIDQLAYAKTTLLDMETEQKEEDY